jgi:hypothetical protein
MNFITRQQRFRQNVQQDTTGGMQGEAFRTKGYTFPTHQQMDKFDKYRIPHNVDPGVRDLVIAINDCGYRTGGSCQGAHLRHRTEGGFVVVNPHRSEVPEEWKRRVLIENPSRRVVDPIEIKRIHRDFNFKVTKYERPLYSERGSAPYHAFNFPAVPSTYEYDANYKEGR